MRKAWFHLLFLYERYNERHVRCWRAMPICWRLSSGWLDVGPAMGAHEQRVHFIKWFIQDMIINGGTLLSRQESIDAQSRHSRSPGLADRERRRSKTNDEQSRHDCMRVFVCYTCEWERKKEKESDRKGGGRRERRRECIRWMMKREIAMHSHQCLHTHVHLLSPFLSLRTLSVYAALRPTPRFQLH